MKFATLLSAVFLLQATAQTFTPAGSIPIPQTYDQHSQADWTGGAFVTLENNRSATPIIHSFDESGQELVPIAFSIPGFKGIQISGASRAPDGSFAVVGFTPVEIGGPPVEAFLSLVSPDHQTIITTRTSPYSPIMVTIAPDGTIWTVGVEHPTLDRSHGVIRHFDKSGHQIGAFLPQSEIPRFTGGSGVVSSKDRIGWYWRAHDYYEVTFDGNLTRYPGLSKDLPVRTYGLTMTDDNEVIIQVGKNGTGNPLYRLDRATRAWVAIPNPPGTVTPRLLGGDGNRIALQTYNPDGAQLKFFTVAPK